MGWQARLRLALACEAGRSVARFEHEGPLRVLQTLYPEGGAIAHNVLVHPPSGLVGGDRLDIAVHVAKGAHGLVTTPGASRFYRSDGPVAAQHVQLRLAEGARLEWLPLESIYYSGCEAENRLDLQLAAGAEAMAWDIAALGLPAAGQPFAAGRVLQHFALDDDWLERGVIAADDRRLLDAPIGLAGHRCLGLLVFATGDALSRQQRELALDSARAVLDAHPLVLAGATSPAPRVVVVRALAPVVEPVMALLRAVRDAWRVQLWQLPATQPRTWAL